MRYTKNKMTNIFFGKRSNLTEQLEGRLDNCISIKSNDIDTFFNGPDWQNIHTCNVVINSSHPSNNLNDLSDPNAYIQNSIINTAKILNYLSDNKSSKVKKLIYTSSSAVYGNNPFSDEQSSTSPINLYGALKLANEKLVEKLCNAHSIPFAIARVFNMFGGNDNFSIISKIEKAFLDNKNFNLVNEGSSIRDFIHIKNVVDAYIGILESQSSGIFNICSGKGLSVFEIINFLSSHEINLKFRKIDLTEINKSTGDNSKLLKILGADYIFIDVRDSLLERLTKIE